MDIRQLRYFIAIAEEGSLSAAAQRLGVAQPALSQHVIALEGRLDVRLLERSSRGVTLTEPGAVLLAHARGVLAAVEATVEAVRQAGAEPQGEVAFGLPSSIASVLSVPLAETVRLELPKVRLRVIDAMSGFIQGWLEDQSIDLGMLTTSPPSATSPTGSWSPRSCSSSRPRMPGPLPRCPARRFRSRTSPGSSWSCPRRATACAR